MDTEKIKFSIRMDEELVRTADAYVQEGMALSRTEMIEDALRFYLGFLSAEIGGLSFAVPLVYAGRDCEGQRKPSGADGF